MAVTARQAPAPQAHVRTEPSEHYLKTELFSLLPSRSDVQDFLLLGAFDGIRYWNLENRDHEWISPGFWRALGYAAEAMPHIAAAHQAIVDPHDLKNSTAALNQHLADPHHPYDQIIRFKHAQGHTVSFRCRGFAIRDDNGVPVRMLCTHFNLSADNPKEHELTEEISSLNLRLENLEVHNKILKDFAAVIAHDLTAPIRQTNMFLNFLEADFETEPAPSDSARNAIANMGTALDRMRRIIKSLHELYRVKAFDIDLRPTPIGAVINNAVALSKEYLDERGAQLNIAGMPTIPVDPDLMTQVFQNILVNACKYSDAENLSIDITVERDTARECVIVYIDDNGSGVPADCAERIFEPYRRLEHADEIEGSGIGLALSRRIMTLHRGAVYVDPHFKHGARFVLSFPDSADKA